MQNAYSILITKVPGGATPVISNGETIAELFSRAFHGESINGYQIQINGETKTSDYIPRPGENVTCAKMVKWNVR